MSIRRIVPVDQTEWSMAPAPSWRLPRDIDWRYRAPEGESVAWLLQDEQHHVASQARSSRLVRQLLSNAAVQALSQVELEFEPDAERLLVHEALVWQQDADGAWRRRTPVPAEAFLLRQCDQRLRQQELRGQVSLVELLEDVHVGDALDVAWTVENPRAASRMLNCGIRPRTCLHASLRVYFWLRRTSAVRKCKHPLWREEVLPRRNSSAIERHVCTLRDRLHRNSTEPRQRRLP